MFIYHQKLLLTQQNWTQYTKNKGVNQSFEKSSGIAGSREKLMEVKHFAYLLSLANRFFNSLISSFNRPKPLTIAFWRLYSSSG